MSLNSLRTPKLSPILHQDTVAADALRIYFYQPNRDAPYGHKMQLTTMRYTHHPHKTLDEIHVGEKVLLVRRPHPEVAMLVSNGGGDAVNAAFVRIAWEGKDAPQLDIFTEAQLCYLAFAEPEPTIDVDML